MLLGGEPLCGGEIVGDVKRHPTVDFLGACSLRRAIGQDVMAVRSGRRRIALEVALVLLLVRRRRTVCALRVARGFLAVPILGSLAIRCTAGRIIFVRLLGLV